MVMMSRASMPNYAKQSTNGFTCSKRKAGHFPDQHHFVRSKHLFDFGLESELQCCPRGTVGRLLSHVLD